MLRSKHPFSEKDAEYYAEFVFGEIYGDALEEVTRKTTPFPNNDIKVADEVTARAP